MSIKYYCDRCKKELGEHEGRDLVLRLGSLRIKILHCWKDIWNGGHICDACLRECVADGETAKE